MLSLVFTFTRIMLLTEVWISGGAEWYRAWGTAGGGSRAQRGQTVAESLHLFHQDKAQHTCDTKVLCVYEALKYKSCCLNVSLSILSLSDSCWESFGSSSHPLCCSVVKTPYRTQMRCYSGLILKKQLCRLSLRWGLAPGFVCQGLSFRLLRVELSQ